MPRPKIDVNTQLLKNTIDDAENDRSFSSLNELYEFVAEVLDVSKSVVMLRIKELGIPLKTKPGKRGRPAGTASSAKTKPTTTTTVSSNPIWDSLVESFAEFGLPIEKASDLLTLRTNTAQQNKAINRAWNLFRDLYDCPGPKRTDPNHPAFKPTVQG